MPSSNSVFELQSSVCFLCPFFRIMKIGLLPRLMLEKSHTLLYVSSIKFPLIDTQTQCKSFIKSDFFFLAHVARRNAKTMKFM